MPVQAGQSSPKDCAGPPPSPSQALTAQRARRSPLAEGSRWGASQKSTAAEGFQAEWTADWAAEVAWGWKITDKSWDTEKQHKAINNRSKFRSVRILDDPTSPGAGAHPASHSSGQTCSRAQPATYTGQSRLFSTVHTAGAARHSTARPHTLPSLRSHLRGWYVAVLILRGQWLTLSILSTVLLRGLAR